MHNILLAIVAWWLSLWDLRSEASWTMPTVLVFFVVTCLLYLRAKARQPAGSRRTGLWTSALIIARGKYAGLFTLEVALTMLTITMYGSGTQNWLGENKANWPTLAACLAATAFRARWVEVAANLVGVWIWNFANLQGTLS